MRTFLMDNLSRLNTGCIGCKIIPIASIMRTRLYTYILFSGNAKFDFEILLSKY